MIHPSVGLDVNIYSEPNPKTIIYHISSISGTNNRGLIFEVDEVT